MHRPFAGEWPVTWQDQQGWQVEMVTVTSLWIRGFGECLGVLDFPTPVTYFSWPQKLIPVAKVANMAMATSTVAPDKQLRLFSDHFFDSKTKLYGDPCGRLWRDWIWRHTTCSKFWDPCGILRVTVGDGWRLDKLDKLDNIWSYMIIWYGWINYDKLLNVGLTLDFKTFRDMSGMCQGHAIVVASSCTFWGRSSCRIQGQHHVVNVHT